MDQGVKVDSHQNQMGDRRPTVPNKRNVAGFEVKLATPLGPIRGRVTIDTGPMRLAHLVSTAYELTNILVERAAKREEKAGRRISCGPKCGVCCCQMIPLSPPEAFYLVDLLDSLDTSHRQVLLERFEAVVNKLKKGNMVEELLAPDCSDDLGLAIAKEYFRMQMPCPFLEEESCSIHPNRPVACREYNVTSPPELCADAGMYSSGIAKVPMPLPLSAPLARLTAHLTGTKARLIPLTLVPVWVAEHDDWRRMEWPGVTLFQRLMEEIGRRSGAETR